MLSIASVIKPIMNEFIANDANVMGFKMSCDYETASLLRTLAASCRHGKLLELGTGAGISTCWILDGMDSQGVSRILCKLFSTQVTVSVV